MGEAKPLASLSSRLLARKGSAQPAMRRPVIDFTPLTAVPSVDEDLGWNDMGEMPEPAPAAQQPAVLGEREALIARLTTLLSPDAPAATRKAAFTLRLNAVQHMRLRIACAVECRSAQQIVIEALDAYLDRRPEPAGSGISEA